MYTTYRSTTSNGDLLKLKRVHRSTSILHKHIAYFISTAELKWLWLFCISVSVLCLSRVLQRRHLYPLRCAALASRRNPTKHSLRYQVLTPLPTLYYIYYTHYQANSQEATASLSVSQLPYSTSTSTSTLQRRRYCICLFHRSKQSQPDSQDTLHFGSSSVYSIIHRSR